MLQSCFLSSLSSDFVFQVCEDGRDREKMRLWEIEEILNLPFFLLFVQRSPFGIALMSCLRGCLSVRECLSICEKARNPQPALLPHPLTEIFFLDSSQQMQIFNLLKLTHQKSKERNQDIHSANSTIELHKKDTWSRRNTFHTNQFILAAAHTHIYLLAQMSPKRTRAQKPLLAQM